MMPHQSKLAIKMLPPAKIFIPFLAYLGLTSMSSAETVA